MSHIIVTSYSNPDLDGYSCAVAYAELLRTKGEDAKAHIWGIPQAEVQWILKEYNITPAEGPCNDKNAKIILVDASEVKNVPEGYTKEQVIGIIDHRKIHEADKFRYADAQIEFVGAAATLVAERFKKAGLTPTYTTSVLLLGAIISQTQNFTAHYIGYMKLLKKLILLEKSYLLQNLTFLVIV